MNIPTYITDLGLNGYQQYFDYIVESRLNGQHTQARELFGELDYRDRQEFLDYLDAEICLADLEEMHQWRIYFGLERPEEE